MYSRRAFVEASHGIAVNSRINIHVPCEHACKKIRRTASSVTVSCSSIYAWLPQKGSTTEAKVLCQQGQIAWFFPLYWKENSGAGKQVNFAERYREKGNVKGMNIKGSFEISVHGHFDYSTLRSTNLSRYPASKSNVRKPPNAGVPEHISTKFPKFHRSPVQLLVA